MTYKCLHKNIFSLKDYSIVSLREEDIIDILKWRNAQIDVLRQKKKLTPKDQKKYFLTRIKPTFSEMQPLQILFSFLHNNKCIGYGGLTHIDWEAKRIEMSFLLNPIRGRNDKIYSADFSAFITLIKMVVYKDLKFNRIFTETFDIRPLHVSLLEKNGFVREGRMKQHVVIKRKFIDSVIHGFLNEYYHA
jgi:hypothetical protein